SEDPNWRKRLLYVGQLLQNKGVHTVIEALARLRTNGIRDLTLNVVGTGRSDGTLHELVRTLQLQEVVTFAGKKDRAELPAIYRQHGTLVMPSCWDEPFAITPLEAMASGVAVVGTTRGGSREIF